MNDRHPIEDELKARLAIGPSPELQARIRAKTSEAVPKPSGWFPLGLGLAAASALAMVFVVLNSGTQPPPRPTEVVSQSPVIVPVEPQPPASVPKAAKKAAPTPRLLVASEVDAFPADLTVEKIDLLPLRILDIPSALAPIPQVVFPTASLEPMKFEPFSLDARVEGVNE
jgi:hypothetical protein